jgi:hypothetical protein
MGHEEKKHEKLRRLNYDKEYFHPDPK